MRLLLPQHFASNCNNADFDTEKFCSTQFWNRNILWWVENGQYTKTVYNTRTSNVPTFYSVPSNDLFLSYCENCEPDDHVAQEYIVFELQLEENDEVYSAQKLSKDLKDINIQQEDLGIFQSGN